MKQEKYEQQIKDLVKKLILGNANHEMLEELKEISKKFHSPLAKAYLLLKESNEARLNVDNNRMYEAAMQSASYAELCNNDDILVMAYNNIGIVLSLREDLLTSFDYFWKSLQIIKNSKKLIIKKDTNLFGIYINIAVTLKKAMDYKKSLEYLDNVHCLIESDEFIGPAVYHKLIIYANKVVCYYELGNYEDAMKYLQLWEECDNQYKGINSPKFSLTVWQYILYSLYAMEEKAENALNEILKFELISHIFDDLLRITRFFLDNKNYDCFEKCMECLDKHTKVQNSTQLSLDIIKIKISYFNKINDEENYKCACVEFYMLQELLDKKKIETNKKGLQTYIDIVCKEEEYKSLEKAHALLKQKSEHDELTELPNRYKLNDFCTSVFLFAIKKGINISIEILDIDYFKEFNDNYGHPKGDGCLVSISNTITSTVSERDLVARIGGDEFVIVRIGYTNEEIEESMSELKQLIIDIGIKHEFSKVADVVTVSQGAVNGVPKNSDTYETFLKIADEALYEAKKVSRNTTVFKEMV